MIPCRCFEKGCEHLMSWHRAYDECGGLMRVACEVPGCFCVRETACEHVQTENSDDDHRIASEIGIDIDLIVD